MKAQLALLLSFFVTNCHMDTEDTLLKNTKTSKYKVGQVWFFHTRSTEPNAICTIVKVEHQSREDTIIHVSLANVKVQTSASPVRYSSVISHMPFSEAAIDASVTKKLGTANSLPDFQEGYKAWRKAFDEGNAGAFSIPVAKAIEYTEQVSLKSQTIK